MPILSVFNFITLNGYYKGENDDISWHVHGDEEGKFSEEGAQSDNIILFGRKTYEMMSSFWPSAMAYESFPVVADGMNKTEKIVFSKTLKDAGWNNTKIISGDIIEKIKQLKETGEKDMTILGSGSIVTQFAEAGIIDHYQIMVDPVVIGKGTPIFSELTQKINLKFTGSKVFKSGVVLLNYVPQT
jgi:dihydrofolate reductase